MTPLLATLLCTTAHGVYLYDMGTPDSALHPDFQRVTVETVFGGEQAFGWDGSEGLEAQVRAYEEPVENTSRGTMDPPPIYTNEVTEDSVQSKVQTRFLADVPAGDYTVHVLCGTSSGSRDQYWDFEVSVGDETRRVQIEGPQRFELRQFSAVVADEPLSVTFAPASRWCVNGIMIVGAEEEAAVNISTIAPLMHATFVLPPEEWEKWQEDPHIPTRAALEPSAADTERGYMVYSRPYTEVVYPNSVPPAHSLDPELRAFASLGEYEPLTFTVYPLRGIDDATVQVSDLTRGDAVIPAAEVDVRHLPYVLCRPNYTTFHTYRRNPDYLEHFDSVSLREGENRRFWLTVHVPEGAEPGIYRGTVTFASEGGQAAEVPLTFRVLPIRLQEDPEKIYGIYYRHPLDRAAGAPDEVSREYFERKARLEAEDLVAHGTRNVVLSCWSRAADEEGRFSFNFDLLAQKLELWDEYGFTPPVVMGFNVQEIYRKYMKEGPGSHLKFVKAPPAEFAAEVTAAVAEIERERKARGWPEFLYYPIDEPGRSAEAVGFMVTVLKACKAVPGARTYVTADPTTEAFGPMRAFIDVWSTQPFDPDRETVIADPEERGVEYWCYPNHVNGENDHTPIAGARMTYGFGFWRSGFRTLIPWIYAYSVGNPRNYLDGRTSDFFNRHEPDGTPVPVAMWEAYREGWDDYRYVYTLQQLIAKARADGRNALADEAQADLDSIWDAIDVQLKYKHDNLWGDDEFNAYRWLVARQILRLQ